MQQTNNRINTRLWVQRFIWLVVHLNSLKMYFKFQFKYFVVVAHIFLSAALKINATFDVRSLLRSSMTWRWWWCPQFSVMLDIVAATPHLINGLLFRAMTTITQAIYAKRKKGTTNFSHRCFTENRAHAREPMDWTMLNAAATAAAIAACRRHHSFECINLVVITVIIIIDYILLEAKEHARDRALFPNHCRSLCMSVFKYNNQRQRCLLFSSNERLLNFSSIFSLDP